MGILVRAHGFLHVPGHPHRALGHVAEEGLVGVFPGPARDLEDDRRAGLDAAVMIAWSCSMLLKL